MNMAEHGHNREQDTDGPEPEALAEAFKAAFAGKPFVPRTVDDAILRAARAHLEPRANRQIFWLPYRRWAGGFAAVVAVVVGLVLLLDRPAPPEVLRADVNRDGRVDILDAFTLGRAVESGGGRIVFIPFLPGRSTTGLVAKIQTL